MILVTGATGNVGSEVVRRLRDRAHVRAFVRDPDKAAALLGNDVELAVGDFADASSVARAIEGADAVLVSSGDGPDKVAHETTVIDAAVAAGVPRIVKCSTMMAEAGSPLPPLDWNGRIEEHLRHAVAAPVILQSNFYMTNVLASADQVRQTGKLFAPAAGAVIGMIDPRDVGAVAALALTDDGHAEQTHELTGPDAIGYADVADALAGATGNSVEFVNVPDEALRQGLTEAGMPEWLVTHLGGLFPRLRNGEAASTTDTVLRLTGRPPRSIAEFARDHAAAFTA
jgi:uncharacterized protein YbjT (DUF2867 family)